MRILLSGLIGATLGAASMWYGMSAFHPTQPEAPHDRAETMAPAPLTSDAEAGVENPAYLIVFGDVYDRDAFMSGYAAKMPPLYERYGGEYLAVGQNKDVLEGDNEFVSYVISKWPSMEAARSFWYDPEYEALKEARIDNGWSEFDVLLLEGIATVPESENNAE